MKLKKLLLLVTAFTIGIILYVLFFNRDNNSTKIMVQRRTSNQLFQSEAKFVSDNNDRQNKLTMKQIDSLSATLNYKFTVSNKVYDSISTAKKK